MVDVIVGEEDADMLDLDGQSLDAGRTRSPPVSCQDIVRARHAALRPVCWEWPKPPFCLCASYTAFTASVLGSSRVCGRHC